MINTNINVIKDKISGLDTTSDVYKALSCIYGAFLGDALGSYVEFSERNEKNYQKILVGQNIFGFEPGQVTDDSEMAMSMAYAIMDSPEIDDLNSDLIFYYYGIWSQTNPPDIGGATKNALSLFNLDTCKLDEPGFFENFKEIIKQGNYLSLANGFLMRISPFVTWFYYRNKATIMETLNNNDINIQFQLYNKIKLKVVKDIVITHPNIENLIAASIFTYIALCSICSFNSKEILEKLKRLLSHEYFSDEKGGKEEIKVRKMIIDESINLFSLTDFNKEEFFKPISEKHIGYYVHGFRLTLFYLVKFNEYNSYREIINEICNCGGDTDTNCAIVGTVIGPLIGLHNFGKDELKIFLSLVPTKRFGYSVGMMYYYVQYLESLNQEENQKKTNRIRFNYIGMLRNLLFSKNK